jgi:SpoVK/Ycf46/Vps4 family AAA+-type ATPase
MQEFYEDLVQIARLALQGTSRDVQLYVRKLARKLQKQSPEAAEELEALLAKAPTRKAPLREYNEAVPVDLDSRMSLAKPEYPVEIEAEPIWSAAVSQKLLQVVGERGRERELEKAGLEPTKTLLLTGQPGVGKSLSARWLARQLDTPLLTLNLAAVMSSYLGRTGMNVRQVLDHAKSISCVLLLDEIDAVAKRRDDEAEIGELKRLVTVLLQEIDEWPSSGLLVGATNHPDLLDPALWRRFDMVIEFPMPAPDQVRELISRHMPADEIGEEYFDILVEMFSEHSFSDIERELLRAKRESIVFGKTIGDVLPSISRDAIERLPRAKRKEIAVKLRTKFQLTERDVLQWTGVSRDTVRSATRETA